MCNLILKMNDRSFYSDSIPSNINKPVGLDGFVAFLEGNMVLRLLFQLFIISLMSKWKFLVIHLLKSGNTRQLSSMRNRRLGWRLLISGVSCLTRSTI